MVGGFSGFSDRWSVVGYFLGKWSVVHGRWSVVGVTVVGGLWSVAGRWTVVLYYAFIELVQNDEHSPSVDKISIILIL